MHKSTLVFLENVALPLFLEQPSFLLFCQDTLCSVTPFFYLLSAFLPFIHPSLWCPLHKLPDLLRRSASSLRQQRRNGDWPRQKDTQLRNISAPKCTNKLLLLGPIIIWLSSRSDTILASTQLFLKDFQQPLEIHSHRVKVVNNTKSRTSQIQEKSSFTYFGCK